MQTSHAAKVVGISQAIAGGKDPKQALIDAVGNLSGVEVLSDLVLVATFIRSEKIGSLIMPDSYIKEDEFQGKAGLVLKSGPLAYADWEEGDEQGQNARLHTWVVCAVKDGWPVTLNGTACRLVPYDKIRLRVADPALIY